jgi:filamentous hemagglutinin
VQQPKEPEKTSEIVTGVIKGGKNILIDSANQFLGTVNYNTQQELLGVSTAVRWTGDDDKADQYINAANKPAMSSIPSQTYDNQYQQQGGYIVEATQVVNSLKNPRPVIKNIDNPAGKLKSVETKDLKVAKVDTGSKGNWDSSINTKNLQANTRYELSNGHTYITDNAGRVNKVEANLSDAKSMDRNTYQQRDVGKSVNSTGDDGGHLIASSLGGAGDRINLVPQASTLNRGDWKSMEAQLARELKNDKSVNIKIDVGYPTGNTVRPNTFIVTAIINNKEKIWRFTQ